MQTGSWPAWIVRRLSPQRPQRPTTDADEVRVRPLRNERMSPGVEGIKTLR